MAQPSAGDLILTAKQMRLKYSSFYSPHQVDSMLVGSREILNAGA
jgi:hypothetical protein